MKTVDLRVKITRKHIEAAEPGQARKCAIAYAILETDMDIVWANVTVRFVSWGRASTEKKYTYRTPSKAAIFIKEFDEGLTPAPFELVLRDDDLVSIKPRQMHQQQNRTERAERAYTAKVLDRDPHEVDEEDVRALRTELAERNLDIPQPRAQTNTTRRSTRPYAKRPSMLDIYHPGVR